MKSEVKTFIIDRVLMVNMAAITVSFTEIEMALRILALVASIAYTVLKIKDRNTDK